MIPEAWPGNASLLLRGEPLSPARALTPRCESHHARPEVGPGPLPPGPASGGSSRPGCPASGPGESLDLVPAGQRFHPGRRGSVPPGADHVPGHRGDGVGVASRSRRRRVSPTGPAPRPPPIDRRGRWPGGPTRRPSPSCPHGPGRRPGPRRPAARRGSGADRGPRSRGGPPRRSGRAPAPRSSRAPLPSRGRWPAPLP